MPLDQIPFEMASPSRKQRKLFPLRINGGETWCTYLPKMRIYVVFGPTATLSRYRSSACDEREKVLLFFKRRLFVVELWFTVPVKTISVIFEMLPSYLMDFYLT